MGISYGAALKPSEIECLLDCKPRFELNWKTLKDLLPYTKVTWEQPFRSLLVVTSQSAQVSSLVQQLKVVNLDVFPEVILRLRSLVQSVQIAHRHINFFSK